MTHIRLNYKLEWIDIFGEQAIVKGEIDSHGKENDCINSVYKIFQEIKNNADNDETYTLLSVVKVIDEPQGV